MVTVVRVGVPALLCSKLKMIPGERKRRQYIPREEAEGTKELVSGNRLVKPKLTMIVSLEIVRLVIIEIAIADIRLTTAPHPYSKVEGSPTPQLIF